MPTTTDDVVDLRGIAELLHVSKHTPSQWRQRRLLPEPDFPELATPLWKRNTIVEWAQANGRWPKGKATESEVGAVVAAVAKLFHPETETPDKKTFKTKEDVRATIPQVVFHQPDLKHVEHVRIEELPREEVVYQLADLEPEEDEVHQAPEVEEEHEETKTAEVVVLPTEVDDEPIKGSRDPLKSPLVEMMVIKGYGATLTFDGEYVIIKHSFAGAVRAQIDQIVGVDLKEPCGPVAGRLRISCGRYQYKGYLTWRPWEFCFGRRQADAVREIFMHLAVTTRRGHS